MKPLTIVGYVTWALVGAQHAWWMSRRGTLFTAHGAGWAAAYAAFAVLFALATREDCKGLRSRVLMAAQTVVTLVCVALEPSGFLAVLLVVVAGQMGEFRLGATLTWITAQSVALGVIFARGPVEQPVAMALAYLTFQLFGAFTARIAHEERAAKQALAEVNAELRVATGLLDLSSRAEERLRIARDLHDVIGHHLTALSLNLEVAGHLTEGRAREQVEKSQALTRRLLNDVRGVVSRLRADEPVDLEAALGSLREAVSRPEIRIETDGVTVRDPAVARMLLRAVQEIVTNSVRHSEARHLSIRIASEGETIGLDAHDDGVGTDDVRFGHGLQGMRERVQQARGTLEVASRRGHGFDVRIRLPRLSSGSERGPYGP